MIENGDRDEDVLITGDTENERVVELYANDLTTSMANEQRAFTEKAQIMIYLNPV